MPVLGDVKIVTSLLSDFFSSRRRHTIYWRDWSSDVCSSDLSARWWAWGYGRHHDVGPGRRAESARAGRDAPRLPYLAIRRRNRPGQHPAVPGAVPRDRKSVV